MKKERMKRPTVSALAGKLEEIQKKSGIRMHDIAQPLDTTPQIVSQWQKGNAEPRQRLLERLLCACCMASDPACKSIHAARNAEVDVCVTSSIGR